MVGKLLFLFSLWTQFWPAAKQIAFKAVSLSLAAPIRPTSFPRGCALQWMRGAGKIWSAGCQWRRFSFLFSPTSQLLLTWLLGRNSLSNRAVGDRVLFSRCLLLLGLSRAETHLGKEGLAFRRFISLYMPFHSLLYVREIRLVGWGWEKPWSGPSSVSLSLSLSLSLSGAKTGLPGLGSLPRGCWVISKVLICLISQGLWKIWERWSW